MRSMSQGALLCVIVLLLAGAASAGENVQMLGPGSGVAPGGTRENPCPPAALLLNPDDTLENAVGWAYGGVAVPDYGAVAEGYSSTGTVCGIELFLTTLPGYFNNQSLDLYVWGSDGNFPTEILSVTTGVHIASPAIWPEVSTFDLPVSEAAVTGNFFVGYWGNWPGTLLGWYIAADINGPGGLPRTKVAPGIGLPTGWIDVSTVWGHTEALGIGAFVNGAPTPATTTSWGAVKSLYLD